MTDPTPNPVPGVPVERASSTLPTPSLDELRAALVLQREADAMVAEALETRRSAVERAGALVREAEEAAERAQEEATRTAAERIAAAHAEADRLLLDAQHQADQITNDARTEVTALRHDAAELRDSAQETLEAAQVELERVRQAEEDREQQRVAALADAVHTIEHLEDVATTLDAALAGLRGELAAARRDLAQLQGGLASADGPAGSVVLPWPHQDAVEAADPATTDPTDAIQNSKNRRIDIAARRGRLRRARS